MCKGSQTTTSNSSYTPNPQALGAYSNLISQAQGVAGTPYVPYTGELVAGVNPQEYTGIGGVNQYAGYAFPAIQSAQTAAQAATAPITSSDISQYISPYTQDVVNATQQQFNLQNAQQQAQLTGNAIAQGALGGNRTGVAAANLANAQQTAQAPVIAGLENTGYTTGLNTALTEQQARLMGAYGQAGIGTSGQAALLSGAGQQIGAGQLEQTTQQALDQALYQQYINQLAYPFQTAQWLAGIEGSIGPQMGGSGTSQTTGPAPSLLSQLGGLGTLGAGLFGSSGAVPYLASALPFLSDERTKENIKAIGRLRDGQIIYRFNYKGDPATHIGLLAQEVEKKHPEAVHKQDGIRFVDYDKATRDSEGVAKRDMGGGMMGMEGYASGYPMTGVAGGVQSAPAAPYGRIGGSSYVPAGQLFPAYPFSWRLPNPPSLPNSQPVNTSGLAELAKGLFGSTHGSNPDSASATIDPSDFSGPAIDANNPYPLGPIYRRGGGVRSRDDGGGLGVGEMGDVMVPPSSDMPAPQEPIALLSNGADTVVPSRSANVPLPQPRPVMASAPSGVAGPPTPLRSSIQLPSYDSGEPRGDYGQNDITSWQHSIGGIESGNNYQKLGPVTKSGDRAYGRYGIMGNNIPSWTEHVLGQSMTPDQFLSSPQAQDAVFRSYFGNYVDKYGLEGAGRAWYAGEGGMNNLDATAHDANGNPIGVTVADYGARFLRGLGLAPPGSHDALPVNAQPTQGQSPFGPQEQGQGVAGGQGFLQKLFPNVDFSANSKLWPALIAAGAGMMSSRSPFPGVAIGEGAQAGLQEYQLEKSAEAQTGFKQTELNQNAQKLQREADQFAANYSIQLQRLKVEQQKEEREASKPVEYAAGLDPWTNQPIKGYAVKNDTGLYVDTQSGKPVAALNGTRQPQEAAAPPPRNPPAPAAAIPQPSPQSPAPNATGPQPPMRVATAEPGSASPMPISPEPPAVAQNQPQVTMTPARGQLRPALPYNPAMLPTGIDPQTIDPKTGIGKDGRDYAYLQSIANPDAAGDVLGLVNYQMDPQSLGYRGINRGKVMAAASTFDPNYHQEWFKDISGTEGAFAHGRQGDQVRFFQNAVEHQQTLLDYAKAMNNGNVQVMNRLKNFFGVQLGATAPNTFEGLRQLVAGEVVKAATGAQGALGDRDEIAKSFNSASSLPQLISLLQGFQDLGGAQLYHLETQFKTGTHNLRGDFAQYMHLDNASTGQLRRQEARDAAAKGGLQSFATPEAVQEAIKSHQLHPGDKFLMPDGRVGTVH